MSRSSPAAAARPRRSSRPARSTRRLQHEGPRRRRARRAKGGPWLPRRQCHQRHVQPERNLRGRLRLHRRAHHDVLRPNTHARAHRQQELPVRLRYTPGPGLKYHRWSDRPRRRVDAPGALPGDVADHSSRPPGRRFDRSADLGFSGCHVFGRFLRGERPAGVDSGQRPRASRAHFGVGLATHASACSPEAAHSGADLVAALLTFFAVGVAARRADPGHQYRPQARPAHLGALGEASFLVLVSIIADRLPHDLAPRRLVAVTTSMRRRTRSRPSCS